MSVESTFPIGDDPPHPDPTALRRDATDGPPTRAGQSARGGWRERVPRFSGSGGQGPRVYKLRLALILAGLAALAVVSTVFGMMMAVASELPALENRQEYRTARNSVLYDADGQRLGVLTSADRRILVTPGQVAPAMQHAIIAVEDKRFYDNNGVDVRGIARALIADLARRRAAQGASTITQQFVKNALAAQNQRTVFQKLREVALAYHLNRQWSKQKILSEYLNAVYYGNGAYGIESAARTYFKANHKDCGQAGFPQCSALLTPAESALIAGMVASPAAYDPVSRPQASRQRRDFVLYRMLDQGYINRAQYDEARGTDPPTREGIATPQEDSEAPYFTTWVEEQAIQRYGAGRVLSGGLRIRTTLDLELQRKAQEAVNAYFSSPDGPAASLVAIDNRTGEVRAMVGGRPGTDYNQAPFNLATQGQRQPGSAFKVFTLAQALREGVSPDSTWASHKKLFDVPGSAGQEKFVVENYESQYAGVASLASATASSDNSVYAEVGIQVGTRDIARMARAMGITTPISTNPAITLGGLEQGVTPLDMAHAYQTLAAGGERVSGTLAPDGSWAPVGIKAVREPGRRGRLIAENHTTRRKVFSKKLAEVETGILESVVCCGTAKAAATGEFAAGKTGTTENYGDAWFVGFNERWTVAVWVGYPDRLRPMETEFQGGPVAGGTFPAAIWRTFILAADAVQNGREAEQAAREGRDYTPPGQTVEGAGTTAAPAPSEGEGQGPQPGGEQPAPAPSKPPGDGGRAPPPTPAPAPPPPPSGGGGAGSGGGTGAPGGTPAG